MFVKGDAKNMKFTPDADGSGNGTLQWDELVVRKGFRPRWVRRTIRKTVLKSTEEVGK